VVQNQGERLATGLTTDNVASSTPERNEVVVSWYPGARYFKEKRRECSQLSKTECIEVYGKDFAILCGLCNNEVGAVYNSFFTKLHNSLIAKVCGLPGGVLTYSRFTTPMFRPRMKAGSKVIF